MAEDVRMVDWDFAVEVGSRVAGKGPEIDAAQAQAVVAQLRADAARSTPLVSEFTGLQPPDDTPTAAPVIVVDRRGWVQANADGFAKIIDPMSQRMLEKKGSTPGPLARAVGSRVSGGEVGAILGFLATKVLGQYDPFHGVASLGSGEEPATFLPEAPQGRLMLVAPTIVHVERELDVDPDDFRLWVCLHEETHRVQFTSVPWMRAHLFSEMRGLIDTLDPGTLLDSLPGVQEILQARQEGRGLRELLGGPERAEAMERITGMMSLLEGHADVVMDGVGPEVIGSVASIREKFNARRQGVGVLDRVVRKLLGLDAKMAQYRDGAAFVRTVVDRVGMADFNAVFAEPANLPTKAEILSPGLWISRVHG